MTITSIKYKSLIALTALAMACSGCHSETSIDEPESPDIPASEPGMVTLCLDVSYDINSDKTRDGNDPNQPYGGPEGEFEQISTLRVIIVRNMDKDHTIGTVEANRLVATSPEGYPLYDNLRFKVLEQQTAKRIYLIANERSITNTPIKSGSERYSSSSEFLDSYVPGKTLDITKLAEWTVSLPTDDTAGELTTLGLFSNSEALFPRLPLTEFFDVIVKPEDTQSQDNIYYSHLFLTRAAAKATFTIVNQDDSSPTYDKVNITGIKLSGIGSEEYVFPRDAKYSNGKYPAGKDALDASISSDDLTTDYLKMYIEEFATPDDCKPMTYLIDKVKNEQMNVPIVDKTSTAAERLILDVPIYFPESILEADKHYEVSVQLSTGVWLTAPLETNILSINGQEAVARNTHLKIALTFKGTELSAKATVHPYTCVWLNPEFGFSRPETDHMSVDIDAMTLNIDTFGLLKVNYTTDDEDTDLSNLKIVWVSSKPEIILLQPEDKYNDPDPTSQDYIPPYSSIELPYDQYVKIVPQHVGETDLTAYSETGLVVRCKVIVK